MEHERRPVGRPKGSPNITPGARQLKKITKDVYKDIEHTLTPEEKKYYKESREGKAPVDPIMEMGMGFKVFSLYVHAIMESGMAEEKHFRDFGALMGHFRGMLTDIESMKHKRAELERKNNDDNSNRRFQGQTRQSSYRGLEAVLKDVATGEAGGDS